MNVKDLTLGEILVFKKECNKSGIKVGEGLKICRAFRDKHGLTDKETLDVINDRIK